jgi:hypothetical protein
VSEGTVQIEKSTVSVTNGDYWLRSTMEAASESTIPTMGSVPHSQTSSIEMLQGYWLKSIQRRRRAGEMPGPGGGCRSQ